MINFGDIKEATIPEGEITAIRVLTNLVDTSIDTDGSIYEGCGYLDGYRLSSSGAIKEYISDYFESTVTGFISVNKADVVYIDNCYWFAEDSAMSYICAYDSNFNFIGADTSAWVNTSNSYGTKFVDHATGDIRHTKIVLKYTDNLAYIRVSCAPHISKR